jgi:anti-repressor protein
MAGYAPVAPFHLTESEVIMNELITVNYDNEQPTVSARELHDFLEVGADFRHWFPRMCEYGFEEGKDFRTFLTESSGGRPAQDAEITIDMAKELCMLQRNDKGKQARQYFLQLERDWNSPEKVMARALQIAHKRIHTLSEKIEQDAPKVLFADSVAASHTSILIFDLAKIVKQNGVDMGGKRLFAWMRDNGYLVRRQGTDYNMPTQRSMELGLFEVKETSVTHSDGHISVNKTPKVTGKGQQYFINRLLGEENRSN